VFVTACDEEVLRCPCVRITPAMMCCGCAAQHFISVACCNAASVLWELCAPGSLLMSMLLNSFRGSPVRLVVILHLFVCLYFASSPHSPVFSTAPSCVTGRSGKDTLRSPLLDNSHSFSKSASNCMVDRSCRESQPRPKHRNTTVQTAGVLTRHML
jgi:hypothetical protein